MISVVFQQPTPRIDDEKQLHKLFGTDRLSLEASASVVFEGAITLGSDILFSGDCLEYGIRYDDSNFTPKQKKLIEHFH